MMAAEDEARTAREAADKHEKVSDRIMSSLSSLKGHLDAVGLAPARRLLLDGQGEGVKEEGEDGADDADGGDLQHQVGDVARREEVLLGQREVEPDHDQPDDDRQRAELALAHPTLGADFRKLLATIVSEQGIA